MGDALFVHKDKTLVSMSVIRSKDKPETHLYDLIDEVDNVVDRLKRRLVDMKKERHYHVRQRRISLVFESVQQSHTVVATVICECRG